MSSPKVPTSKGDEEKSVRVQVDENKLQLNISETAHSIDTSNDVEELVAIPKSSKSGKCRKNEQCIQQALRSLNRLSTSEEKFTAICAKYADIFDENRKLQTTLKEHQKQIAALTKDKDQARSELMKTIFTKDKLENLCRELQRQNREIREESLHKIKEEEQKRKEVSTKFQTTLNEITELMKQDSDKTMKLRDDNVDMTSKLKSIYEQYEIREQQIERMTKQMALESQLYEAKIAKLEMETAAEKEVLLREKQQLLLTLTEYQAKFQEYQNIEVTLRNQVALYNNKYEEFEKSLTRSNEVFGGFKTEMENMSNKIVKLESETAAWKSRWEKTQKALIEMASEKQKSDQEIVLAAKQMATLHKLCRTLQSERTQLLAALKQGTSQNETENNSNVSADINNLLETKIIDENLQISQNFAEEKNTHSKSKANSKLAQGAEKSSSIPKTKLKADKKRTNSTQNNCNGDAVNKRNDLETAIAQIDINKDLKNQSSPVSVEASKDPISVDGDSVDNVVKNTVATKSTDQEKDKSVSSTDIVPVLNTESKNEIASTSNSCVNNVVTVQKTDEDGPSEAAVFKTTSVSSAAVAKPNISKAEVNLEYVESVPKDSAQNNKKKALSKKKNKK